MDPFLTFPDIELENLCKTWDNPTLLRASEASSRVYQICFDERERRKKRYFEKIEMIKQEVETIWNKLMSERSIQFKKKINNITIWLTLTTYGAKVYISQIVKPEEAAPNITWIVNPNAHPSIESRGIYANRAKPKV